MAGVEALQGPQELTYEFRDEFKARRDVFVGGLNEIPGIRCPMPMGAFYAFPNIEGTGMTSRRFADDLLQDYGVASLARGVVRGVRQGVRTVLVRQLDREPEPRA